jgi:hypothetical protein
MVQHSRRLTLLQLHIDMDGMALIGPDPLPILTEAVPLFPISPHDFLYNLPVHMIPSGPVDTINELINLGPAMPIQPQTNNLRLMAQSQADELAYLL